MKSVQFETPSLLVGKASFSDWEALYRSVWSHAETARYMLWTPTASEAEAQSRMERTLLWQQDHTAFTVYEKAGGQAIGFAGLVEVRPGVYEDTGLALGPAYVGRGLGTELLRGLLDHAFGTLHARLVICSCRRENEASRRLQLRCGLRFDHAEPRTDPRTGQPYTLEFYTIGREGGGTSG